MFGVELDTIKKIEIGFCVIVLGIATWLIIKAARGTKDETVQGYSDAEVLVGENANIPVSAKNPIDPNKSFRNTWFINSDGRLQFKEFTRKINSDSKAEMHFYPDPTKKVYDCFPTVRQTIAAYKEDDKRVLSEAVIQFITVTKNNNERAIFTSSANYLRDLGLSQTELSKINTDCENLIKEIKQVDIDVALGSYESKKYDKVLAALQEFRDCGPGEISSDPRKAAAAKKVMQVGLEYMKLVQDKKLNVISDYVGSVLGMLNADQKAKIVALSAPKTPNRGTGPTGNRPPAGNNPTTRPRRGALQPGI